MATFYSKQFPSPSVPQKMIDEKGARLRTSPFDITTTAAIIATTDFIRVARIPSNARLVDIGQVTYGAFGGAAAFNIGLDHEKMSGAERTAAANKLWAAQSVVAAGSRKLMHAPVLADLEKRVWQLAGLTKDPGGEMDVVIAASTVTANIATIHGEITFTTD